eukprot:scaffold3145_cov101-Isochrysis_galbana.AAC.6
MGPVNRLAKLQPLVLSHGQVCGVPTHDYVKGKSGYDKLVVYVDFLTRWIEAHPVNGDPSSEDVLDIFMELVVSRHGMPRTLRTDLGSNLPIQPRLPLPLLSKLMVNA